MIWFTIEILRRVPVLGFLGWLVWDHQSAMGALEWAESLLRDIPFAGDALVAMGLHPIVPLSILLIPLNRSGGLIVLFGWCVFHPDSTVQAVIGIMDWLENNLYDIPLVGGFFQDWVPATAFRPIKFYALQNALSMIWGGLLTAIVSFFIGLAGLVVWAPLRGFFATLAGGLTFLLNPIRRFLPKSDYQRGYEAAMAEIKKAQLTSYEAGWQAMARRLLQAGQTQALVDAGLIKKKNP